MNPEWRAALVPAPGLMPSDRQLHMFIASREPQGDIEHFTSRDGLIFHREGPALRAGEGASWEQQGLGGAQVIAGQTYRMIYAGFGEPDSEVCCAIGCAESPDLSSWRRCDGPPLLRPARQWYEVCPETSKGVRPVWGDPFILYDRKERVYRAYISARRDRGGSDATRACIAGATSNDTVSWEVGPPVYAPGRFDIMGAPLLLQRGSKRHLLFHVPESPTAVRICRAGSDSPEGPFEPVEPETFYCGRNVCVRPAAFADDDMLLFVHAARRERVGEARDIRPWPALLRFDPNGTPYAAMHPAIRKRQGDPIFQVDAELESKEITVRLLPRRSEDLLLATTVFPEGARRAGVLFRTSLTGRDNTTLWLNLETREVSLHDGVAGEPLITAPCGRIGKEVVRLAVAAVGPLVAVYVDDVMVMSGALATRPSGGVGLAVERGKANFTDVSLRPLLVRD